MLKTILFLFVVANSDPVAGREIAVGTATEINHGSQVSSKYMINELSMLEEWTGKEALGRDGRCRRIDTGLIFNNPIRCCSRDTCELTDDASQFQIRMKTVVDRPKTTFGTRHITSLSSCIAHGGSSQGCRNSSRASNKFHPSHKLDVGNELRERQPL